MGLFDFRAEFCLSLEEARVVRSFPVKTTCSGTVRLVRRLTFADFVSVILVSCCATLLACLSYLLRTMATFFIHKFGVVALKSASVVAFCS